MANIIKSRDQVNRKNIDLNDGTYAEVVASAGNMTTKARDAFESYDPADGRYAQVLGTGDLAYADGNAAAASYLVLSKSPLYAGTETSIEGELKLTMPVEIAVGLSMSQRTLGQDFSIELVSDDVSQISSANVNILNITQSTTTLTVNTTTNHGLSVGKCIGIAGVNDSRMNYNSLVVASVPSPTQFTATAGPGGTIPSLSVGPFTSGYVFHRPRLGGANDGISMILENATVTNASYYTRSEAGDAYPSGTVAGNHSVTIGTTASVQLVNSAYQYAFAPTTEYKLVIQADRVQVQDQAIDVLTGSASRLIRSSVVPSPAKQYKLRMRARNADSMPIPVGQIVTAVKTGTTTATVTFDRPHGLTTADVIVAYGTRDQTNFANLATATAVASIVSPTQITVVWGAAVTATTYGGFVARVQGGNLMSALGAVGQTVQSAALSTLADGTRRLVLVGSAAWAAPAVTIGDTLDLIGCRDIATGASLNIDGAWKIASAVTTTLTLVLPYANSMTLPADFTTVNCGGGLVRRTELRISYIRAFDFARERVEWTQRPTTDVSASIPAVITNTPAVTVSSGTITTVTTVSTLTGGAAAEDAATTSNPLITGGVVRTAASPTTLVAGDAARATMTSGAAMVVYPYAVPETSWQYVAAAAGILNTTTAVTIRAAAGAGLRNYITSIQIMSEALTNATELAIRDGAGGAAIYRTKIPTGGLASMSITFPQPIRGTANTLLEVVTLTASGAGAVYFNAQGFAAA